MKIPKELKYTKEHEWVHIDGEIVTVGITEFAQSELGEVVFVELPEVGNACTANDTLCVVESTKAASDVYAPVGGTIQEVNSTLVDAPDRVNSDPYGEGWMVRLTGVAESEVAALMSAEEYQEMIA